MASPLPAEGEQFAELNAREPGMLYQDVKTTPGQTIYWRLAHREEMGKIRCEFVLGQQVRILLPYLLFKRWKMIIKHGAAIAGLIQFQQVKR